VFARFLAMFARWKMKKTGPFIEASPIHLKDRGRPERTLRPFLHIKQVHHRLNSRPISRSVGVPDTF
jgi:hypothetical protein